MKKKLLALTVLFVSVLIVPWHYLAAQTNPLFEENFDAVSAKELPGGWTETHVSHGWSVITQAKENGKFKGSITSNVIWCDSYYNNEMSSFTTSEFTLPQAYGYVLDFDLLGSIDNKNENELLCVYVVDETEAQTPVASGLNGSDDSWTYFENISLSAFSGKTVKLKFEFKGDYGSYDIAIDNISVKLPPACAKPDNLEVISVTANSATVKWSMPEGAGAIASDFNYIADYGGSEKQIGKITSEKITVADGVYTAMIEGLKPASYYFLQLSGACDGEDSKVSLPVSFSTECAVITDIDDFVRFYDLTKSVYPCWEIGPKSKDPVPSGWYQSLYVTLSDYLKSCPVKKINPVDIEVVVRADGGWKSPKLDVDVAYTDEDGQLQNITVGSVACSSGFKDYYFNFTSLTNEQKNLIADKEWNLYFKAEDGNSVKIQSVDIHKRPNYFPVKDVNVSNIGKNSAKLSWKPAEATDTKFAVTYTIGKFGTGEGVTKTETITDQMLDISDLDPLVRYEISGSVVTLNPDNADDKSRPAEFSFVFDTQGDPIEVNEANVWIENFNQGVENNSFYMPVGLNVIGDNDIDSKQYFRINGSGINKSLCMWYYSQLGNKNPHVLVFPEFALTMGQTYRFSFYLSRSTSTPSETALVENNSVFVYTSATSEIGGQTAVDFVPLFSSMEPVVDGSAYRRYSVEFTPTDENEVKFIILQVKCDQAVSVYFDNFELALKPEIETILYPVSAVKITHESAIVSVSSDEDLADVKLQAVAVPKGALPTSSDGILSDVSESATQVTISGLAEKTEYDIYLRVVNGDKHSLWSAYCASITTHCTPITLPDEGYYNNFDDCYVYYSMTSKTGLYETPCYLLPNNNNLSVIDERGVECGTYGNYVRFYPRGEATEEGGKRCAIGRQFDNKDTRFYKEIFLKAGQGYKMSVYATSLNLEEYLPDSKVIMKMVVGETTDIAENTVFGTFDIPVMLLNDENVNAAWNNQYIGYFKAPQDGIYSVGFSFVVEGFSKGSGVWAIDDWRIDFEDYMPITASVVAEPDKATFTFNDGDGGDTYKLRILAGEFGKTEIETIEEWAYSNDNVKEVSHTVTGLAENTVYYYSVARTNGEKTSIWSEPVMFITPCFDSNVTGYTDKFGEMTENEVPACWTVLVNNKGVEVVNTNSDNDGLKKSVSVGNGDMVASPRFASTLNGYVLKGKVLSFTAGATFTVGVNKSVEYAEDETPAIETELYTGTVFTDRVWQDFTVYFVGSTEEELADKANYFVMTTKGGDCRFAELKIEDMPACPALVSGTIDYESVTPTSVNVTLKSTALTTPTGWYVVAKPKSSEVKEVTTELITAIDNSVTISGLEYVTTYSVYAKVACVEDSNSDEVLLGDITTGCPVETVPYTYTADEAKKIMPQCWSVETNDDNKEWMWGNQWVESASAIDIMSQSEVATEQNAEPQTTLVTAEIAITKTSYAEFTYTIEGQANITVLVIDQNGEEHEMAMFAVNADNVTKGFLIPEEFIGQNIRVAFRAGMNRGIYGSENEDPIVVKLSGFSIKDEDVPEISGPTLSVTSDDARFTVDSQSGKNNVDFGVIGESEVLELIFKVKAVGTSDVIMSPKENLKSKFEIEPAFVPADGQEHEVKLKVTPDYNDYWRSPEINIIAMGIGSQKVAMSWTIASLGLYAEDQICDEEIGMCYKDLGDIELGKNASCEINVYGGDGMSGVIEFTTDNTDAVCTPQQIQLDGYVEDVITLTVTPTQSGAQQAVVAAAVDRFKFTYIVKWTAVEPVIPEIIVESTSGVIGDDHTVTFDNVKFGSHPEFVLTVKGTDLMGDITVSVSGDNSDNITSDKDVVTISEAESGVDVKFVISADSRDGGSALITFTSAGAADYLIPVVWTVDRSTVGVDNVSLNSVVYSTGGVVYVKALEGSEIAVYSIQGHPIATATAESGLTAINGIDAGVVIISVNGVAHKVVVR